MARFVLLAGIVLWFQPVDGNLDSPNTGLTPLLERKTPEPRYRFSLIVVSGCLSCSGLMYGLHGL